MSEIWEKPVQNWYNNSRTPNLKYLDLASFTEVSTNQLAHNLSVIYDRTCLSSKVHLKNFKQILERCQSLEKEVVRLTTALRNLTTIYTDNTPLTKQEVQKLVTEIAEQPKLVEKEALKLTEDLNRKIERVEALLHKLERWTSS